MARMKVIGVSVKSGVYQDNPYKNLILYTTYKDTSTEGLMCESVKVKFKNINDALNLNLTASEVDKLGTMDFINLIGKEIKVHYDQYGKKGSVEDIYIFPDDKPTEKKL